MCVLAGEISQRSASAITSGPAKPFSGIGTASFMIWNMPSSSNSGALIGVRTTPGATAFSGMPAPAHSGAVQTRRTHWASADFDDGYSRPPAPLSSTFAAAASAAGSSRPRQARTVASSTGCVPEIEPTTAARGASARASAGRSPSSSPTTPKKFTLTGMIVKSETPAQATTASSRPPARSSVCATAPARPSGTLRSARTSASCRSIPMTVSPASRSIPARDAPMPDAEPLTAMVRAMSLS